MSGSFEDIDVPPTLVSFAVDYTKASHVVTPEFKKAGNNLLRVDIPFDEYGIPDYKEAGKIYDTIHKLMRRRCYRICICSWSRRTGLRQSAR